MRTCGSEFKSIFQSILLNAIVALGLVAANAPSAYAQDFGVPDSVYYMPIDYYPSGCTDEIRIRVPIYLWSDGYARFYGVRLRVTGITGCEDARVYFLHSCSAPETLFTCNSSDSLVIAAKCYDQLPIAPGSGVVGEFLLRAAPGDSVELNPMLPLLFTLSDYSNYWYPLHMQLDTQFVVPTSIEISAGDVDGNGNVTISDAVYLIQYIFGGGCSPYNVDSADPNADCLVSISDVVYLIGYIFAGGGSPLPGCVGTTTINSK